MSAAVLSSAQEAQAQALAGRVRAAVDDEILRMARLLVSKDTEHLFGQTELEVRDLALGIGAKAFALLLAEKKTATRGRASPAPAASRRPSSRATGPRRR